MSEETTSKSGSKNRRAWAHFCDLETSAAEDAVDSSEVDRKIGAVKLKLNDVRGGQAVIHQES